MSKKITPTKADLTYVQRCIKAPTSSKEHAVKNLAEMLQIVAAEKNSGFGLSSAPDYLVKYFAEFDKQYPDTIQRSRISAVCHDLAFNNNLNYPDAPAKKNTTNSWFILVLLIGGCIWVDAGRVKPQPTPTPTHVANIIQPISPTFAPILSTATPIPPEPTLAPIAFAPILATECPIGCTTPPTGCNIKGNISIDTAAKIYHLPHQKFYAQTIIDPRYGERWFCTEQEATANGWRPSAQ